MPPATLSLGDAAIRRYLNLLVRSKGDRCGYRFHGNFPLNLGMACIPGIVRPRGSLSSIIMGGENATSLALAFLDVWELSSWSTNGLQRQDD